jgi:hypothetical protein
MAAEGKGMSDSRSAGAASGSGGGAKPQTGSSGKHKKAELRRHVRFVPEKASAQLYLKGFLTSIGINRKNEAQYVVNLSESGALIVLSSKFQAGTKVQVRIEMEKFQDVIEAEGEIRWCYQSARDATEYFAGVMFKNLPAIQATRISKMRDWFTSPEYKLKSSTRRRLAGPLEADPPLKFD